MNAAVTAAIARAEQDLQTIADYLDTLPDDVDLGSAAPTPAWSYDVNPVADVLGLGMVARAATALFCSLGAFSRLKSSLFDAAQMHASADKMEADARAARRQRAE